MPNWLAVRIIYDQSTRARQNPARAQGGALFAPGATVLSTTAEQGASARLPDSSGHHLSAWPTGRKRRWQNRPSRRVRPQAREKQRPAPQQRRGFHLLQQQGRILSGPLGQGFGSVFSFQQIK